MASVVDCVKKRLDGTVNQRFQLASVIRASTALVDDMGLTHDMGSLQQYDLNVAKSLHAHRFFVGFCFQEYRAKWATATMKVFQIHQPDGESLRVHGTLVTDGDMNFVRYCVENEPARFARKNRQVMHAAIKQMCTHLSICSVNFS